MIVPIGFDPKVRKLFIHYVDKIKLAEIYFDVRAEMLAFAKRYDFIMVTEDWPKTAQIRFTFIPK